MTPFQWSLAALGGLVVAGVAMALTNEEVAIGLQDLPGGQDPRIAWSGVAAMTWKQIRYEADRDYVGPGGETRKVTVRYRLDNLGNGLVRRTDDWYPRDVGGALLYEERYVLLANLVGLASRYREPAPLFHNLLPNEGWFRLRPTRIEVKEEGADPGAAGWRFEARIQRVDDPHPLDAPGKTAQVTREMTCRPDTAVGRAPQRPVVACESRQSDGFVRSSRLTYLPELGIFVLEGAREGREGETLTNSSNIRNFRVDGAPFALN